MEAASFDEANVVLDKPPGMEECNALNVWRGLSKDGVPVVISCWKITKEELQEVLRTGRVWLWIIGETMPPVALATDHPFQQPSISEE